MVEILYNLIESTFAPFIAMGPAYAIASVSVLIAAIISLSYKFLMDKNKVKYLREEQKDLKKKMDKAKKSNNPQEMNKLIQKSLSLNNQTMMLSIKPLLATMLLIPLFLPWLAHAYGDITSPLDNQQGIYEYGITNSSFTLNSDNTLTFENNPSTYAEGDTITIGERTHEIEYEKDEDTGTITDIKFQGFRADLPFSIPFVGNWVGWLGFYIFMSMPATFLFRKLLDVQ